MSQERVGTQNNDAAVKVHHYEFSMPLDMLRNDRKTLGQIGNEDHVATQQFREHQLIEGEYKFTEENGGPENKLVYCLLDPEEIAIPLATPKAVKQLKSLTDKEVDRVRRRFGDDSYQYTTKDVIIGDPKEPAIATRNRLKQIIKTDDGKLLLTVFANVNYPRNNFILPAWTDEDDKDSPRRSLAFGGRTGESLKVQRIVGGMTRLLDQTETYEYTPDSQMYVVGVDPEAVASQRGEPKKIDKGLTALLKQLSGRNNI